MARVKKNRSVSSRNLEDHVVGQVGITEQTDKGALEWEATQGEVHSDIKLEDDHSTGKAVVLRAFDYVASPLAFKHHIPTKQELFSAHQLQIEGSLYADELKIFEEVPPKVLISKNKKKYRIIVAGLPWGMNRTEIPTLSQITNDRKPN